MKKSIRYYVFSTLATVLVASVLGMGMVQMYLASNYFKREQKAQLSQLVTGVSEAIQVGLLDPGDDSFAITYYMGRLSGTCIYVADTEGKVVFSTEPGLVPRGAQVPGQVLAQMQGGQMYYGVGRLGSDFQTKQFTAGLALFEEGVGVTGYVFASSAASGLSDYLSEMLSSFILAAGAVLLIASVVALVLSERVVAPLRRISEAAHRFGNGDYTARVPVEGDDELAQLALTFNEMANSFEATDASRRSFMGNIAHELRTPMTTIKGFIDGMLDGTIPPEQQPKYLGIVSEEVGRLARLTQNMLDVSKLETGEYVPKTTEFDVWGSVTAVFLAAEQRLVEKRIDVRGFGSSGSTAVLADKDFVHQILYNLLDNAIKFTPEGGTIEVAVETDRTTATIFIQNTGDGMSDAELSHIFDRFYKADTSRGINTSGVGLGLHICKVLTGLMGGRIWAESEADKWSRFCFTLPLAPPQKAQRRNG